MNYWSNFRDGSTLFSTTFALLRKLQLTLGTLSFVIDQKDMADTFYRVRVASREPALSLGRSDGAYASTLLPISRFAVSFNVRITCLAVER